MRSQTTTVATAAVPKDSYEKDESSIDETPNTSSYGVLKAEAGSKAMTNVWKYSLFGFLAVCAYGISLDQYTTPSYEVAALATTFGQHTLIATINTFQAIFAAVAQPPFAKLCDLVGRWEAYCFSAFMYCLGYIIVASSQSVAAYAAGQCIYQFGITGFWLVTQVIVADNTSLRSRVFWAISPSILGTINVWVAGNVAADILGTDQTNWRWGYGMFIIITPVLIAPVIFILGWTERQAKSRGYLDSVRAPWKGDKLSVVMRDVFWQVDFIGLFLLVAAFSLLLVPITIYAQVSGGWSSARIIAPFVIGVILVPVFFIYEGFYASHPIMPPSLFKKRSIVFGFAIGFVLIITDAVGGSYLYTWYQVAGNQSVLSATRLSGISTFSSVLSVAVLGLLIIKFRRNKPFMMAGALIEVLIWALMTRFRGPSNTVGEMAVLQVFRGIGYGMVIWPTQSNIQASIRHEQVALVTAAFLALYYLGGAVGSALAGAIWSSVLPPRLQASIGQPELAATVFADPITFITQYPIGTPERTAVINAYSDAQRILLAVSAALSGLVFILTCLVENPRLPDTITMAEVENGKSIAPGEMKDPEKAAIAASRV